MSIEAFKADPTFLKVVPLVLNSEGGYSNHPDDPGGPTMRGIAWNYNAGWLKENLGYKSSADIVKLTADQARWCYYDRYWVLSNALGVTDVDLAYLHFDTAVNCGVDTAKKFLAKLSKNPKNYDGSFGRNRSVFLQLFLEYFTARLSYYTHCRKRDKFLEGWVNRMVQVFQNAKNLD